MEWSHISKKPEESQNEWSMSVAMASQAFICRDMEFQVKYMALYNVRQWNRRTYDVNNPNSCITFLDKVSNNMVFIPTQGIWDGYCTLSNKKVIYNKEALKIRYSGFLGSKLLTGRQYIHPDYEDSMESYMKDLHISKNKLASLMLEIENTIDINRDNILKLAWTLCEKEVCLGIGKVDISMSKPDKEFESLAKYLLLESDILEL